MTVKHLLLSLLLSAVLSAPSSAGGMDPRSLARLKNAGVEDATIEALVRERAIETAAFTVDDILSMKAAGIGEDTLRTLIREGSFMKDREPVVYGNEQRPVRLATTADLIRLKQAGVSDDVLQAVAAAGRRGSDAEREQILQRLQDMGIWVQLPR